MNIHLTLLYSRQWPMIAGALCLCAMLLLATPASGQTASCEGLLECAERHQLKTPEKKKGKKKSSTQTKAPPSDPTAICRAFRAGKYTIADLPSVLANCDSDVRERAYQVLQDLKKHEAIAPFIKGLSDKDEIIRVVSAVAMFALKYNSINLLRKLIVGIHDGSITIESVEDLIHEYEENFREMAEKAKMTMETEIEEVDSAAEIEKWKSEMSTQMDAIAKKADPVIESLKKNPTINNLYQRYQGIVDKTVDDSIIETPLVTPEK